MQLGQAHMRFSYADSFGGAEQALDAYERLIHDVMVGDRTLFTTSEAIERLWEIADPLLRDPPPVEIYEPGSWGPEAAEALIAPHHWHAARQSHPEGPGEERSADEARVLPGVVHRQAPFLRALEEVERRWRRCAARNG